MLMVIIKKELKRVFSDRGLVFSAFILPALTIFIIYSVMGSMLGNMMTDNEEHISVIHMMNAPESYLNFEEQHEQLYENIGIKVTYIEEVSEFEKNLLKSGEIDLLVVFGEDFDEHVANYNDSMELPQINTFYNPSESYSSKARSKFNYDILSEYEDNLLEIRFGNADFSKAFGIDEYNDEKEVFDEAKATGTGLSMILPMLITIFLFSGAMGIGMDTIAGEKERGTMATLLLTPVPRETIALGKLIGLAIVAIISASCSFLGVIASLPNAGAMVSGGQNIQMSTFGFSVMQLIQLLIIMLSMVGVFVGLICVTSAHAKSVKEAGTYTSPIMMVVMLAAFSTMFQTGEPEVLHFGIPIYGNIMAIKQLLTFELGMDEFLLASGVAIAMTVILTYIITKLFKNERIILNN